MKTKPQPKRALILTFQCGDQVMFRAATPGAASWLEAEATQFGNLCAPGDGVTEYSLRIHAEYDTQEVVDYLMSYSDRETDTDSDVIQQVREMFRDKVE